MDIYLISDTHFGHKNMIEWALRPSDFEDKIWRSLDMIPENSILIHLGDVSMGSDAMTHIRLQGYEFKKWLVRGNHDNHSIGWYMKNGWDFVADEIVIKMFGKNTLFSHIPMPKRVGIDRNVHGHLHGSKSHPRPDFYDEEYHVEICPEVIGYSLLKLSGTF